MRIRITAVWTEGLLAALGFLVLIYLFSTYLEVHAFQTRSGLPHKQQFSSGAGTLAILGRIEIPDLNLSVAILPNYDSDSLIRGVGHIPGSAFPGGLGTVGLAAHRDTFFRPLRRLRSHMQIRLVDQTGTYRYAIDSTEVVTPDRVDVLKIGTVPGLVLITCYPFDYIGAAPKRFIVHAHLMSASPDF